MAVIDDLKLCVIETHIKIVLYNTWKVIYVVTYFYFCLLNYGLDKLKIIRPIA